ncbi:MAG: MerR family transcriptional regulator [Streptosporangiaceae bacterium]|nr:MerR family transcriptional regulator [Streptosporangiaceae bacterium]
MDGTWTILELAEHAAEVLAGPVASGPETPSGPAAGTRPDSTAARANGRIRDVPNERLIRWYVTVGLVDPPLSRRGRIAQYGARHLLQLVAVKRRQAEGRSLAEIQEELTGATDEVLAAVARVPDIEPAPDVAWAAVPARFWTHPPRQTSQPEGTQERHEPPKPAAEPADQSEHGTLDGLVRGVRLAPGVILLLEGAEREPGPDDVTEIVDAARPLLRELANRGLRVRAPNHPPGGAGHAH